ncbi:hypothetical protein [Clostridium perfringens]|uniref:hypothetical protein n=1 Tax=Clostridium perfringens TaxID=1502 RepID=UPI002B20512D|nr:hypothetical protein [Clostridium perfringens]MEA5268683.1 hypothetical protein [Clostridium perfringens]MEA5380394.1 hypothetical protein [Clostridium perfringens]
MDVLSEKAKKFTEAFEHCMKNEPLALRNAMGMNRQQFKSMQREQKKMEEAMKKLTPVQFKLIDMLIRQERRKVDQEVTERTIALNSCVNAALTETVDWTCDEIDKFWKVVNEMIPGDIQARSEMQKMNEKERVEMEAKVREFIVEALEADKGVREIKEELKFKFPKLSSAQRTNAVKEIKEEWMEQKGAERIAKIISGEEDKEVEKEPVKKEIVVNEKVEKTKVAEEKIEAGMESIALPTISEQITSRLLNFKKEREVIYKTILEYENFISAKREELEVIKEKEKNVEKAIELLSSVGI